RRQSPDDAKHLSLVTALPQTDPKGKFKATKQPIAIKLFKEHSYDSQGVLIPQFRLKDDKSNEQKEGNVSNNDTIISILVAYGADLNSRDKNEATPLHYAAMRRNLSATEELLSYSILNLECKDNSWMTPLHYAAEQGCVPIASMLIERGAYIEALNIYNMTPLHFACEEGHQEVAELLIFAVEKTGSLRLTKFINMRDLSNQTALVLLHAEPNLINIRNENLETPLHISAALNKFEITKYLLEQQNIEIDCRDKDTETPLHIATSRDHINIVELLISKDASINLLNANDYTPLHIAAVYNSLRCASFFLSLTQSENMQKTWDFHENRPIHLAVMYNNFEMVQLLIKNDAPLESKNDSGLTPLLMAASHGYIDIMKALINLCPRLALDEDDSNNTALHLAAENGFFRAIPILVNSGTFVDRRNSFQFTALDIACSHGHIKAVAALIDAEATINSQDTSKNPIPLFIASQNGHGEVISLLLGRGADANKVDLAGRNCLEVSIDENRKDAVTAILNSSQWEKALRHVSYYNGFNSTPLRRLIDIMPDSAKIVFDKCITTNLYPKNHPKHQIFCNYEYLEDMYTPWGASLKSLPERKESSKSSNFSKIYSNVSNWSRKMKFIILNRNHPLSTIIDKKRSSLLSHPLVRHFVRYKWNQASFYIYYLRMLLYFINIVFLTGLCLKTASPPYQCNSNASLLSPPIHRLNYSYSDGDMSKCLSCPYIPVKNNVAEKIFVSFGKYIVLILSLISCTSRVLSIICHINNIANVQTILEIIGSIFSIIYVSGLFTFMSYPVEFIPLFRCTNSFRSIGAIGICLTWLSFVLFLSKLAKIGIYVVMYTEIFRTFLQFVPVYFMLIITFSLPFYMLFLDRYETDAYVTPFKAIMKTLIATVGEIEYDTFYNTREEPPLPVTYIILFLFILSNSIILMNLLVGLAVDDIQGVQSIAFIKKLGLQVKMTMEFESVLPDKILKRFIIMDETITPNEGKQQSFWSWWEFKSNPFADNKDDMENFNFRINESIVDVKDSMRSLRHQMKALTEKNQKIETLLEELLKRQN
ncbi:hypothetical protein MXB_317, partial [Myxobolus squamalis]